MVLIPKGSRCCGLTLRPLCLLIGYLHLASSITDMICHLMIVAIVTNGFQCDVNNERLMSLSVPGLEPVMMLVNLGTHGFHPYPRFINSQYHVFVDQLSVFSEPKCYPGMLHIYLMDVLHLLINLIWIRIVISYVIAVHKGNPEPMRLFFSLSIVKLIMMVMYFGYSPNYYDVYNPETIWFMKLTDIFIALVILIVVQRYTRFLKTEKAANENIEKPPPYIECLINSPVHPPKYEPKSEVVIVDEEKKLEEGATETAVRSSF